MNPKRLNKDRDRKIEKFPIDPIVSSFSTALRSRNGLNILKWFVSQQKNVADKKLNDFIASLDSNILKTAKTYVQNFINDFSRDEMLTGRDYSKDGDFNIWCEENSPLNPLAKNPLPTLMLPSNKESPPQAAGYLLLKQNCLF